MFFYSSKTRKTHLARNELFSLRTVLSCAILVISISGASVTHAENLSKKLNNDDRAITNAVENVLRTNRAIPITGINVTVTKGIVDLKGKTTNVLAKQRAQNLAETVRGVRAVINQIVVAPPTHREDWLMEQDIESALFENRDTDASNIYASVKNGIATLTGKVQSNQEKELAKNLALSVPGINAVVNDIDIDYQVDRADFDIKEDVKERLRWDAVVEDGLIRVDVQKGKVILSGAVGSAAEKSRAYFDAWVRGVVGVDDDNLSVKAWAYDRNRRHDEYVSKTESQIRRAVNDALLYDPRIKSFNVGVDVDINTVTLHGVVDNSAAKRAASQDARGTAGVFLVRNHLTVRSGDAAQRSNHGKRS